MQQAQQTTSGTGTTAAKEIGAALRESLTWRSIGPHRGGRVVAVAGDPRDPMTFYFGACAGGVWKTTDGGTNWECITDGFFQMAAVGALAVSASDPNILYVGTGEPTIRGNVSHGDGVYKSTDGGKTWTNTGLAETRHISKIRIHATNPDVVYVAALGHAWGPNAERGVYRSTDGGKSWQQVLFRSETAGAIDLSMDPGNPRVLYAAFWEGGRTPWSLNSGGPGSSLYKSSDGGDTWTELTRNPGLPTGVIGKIGVAVSPARPERVWALVEAEDGALFRSDDGGATWQRGSEQPGLRWRAWYYNHVIADPQDADTVYVMNGEAWKSTDGGKTFVSFPTPHGDNHDLWIDPRNTRRMINGNDGGACVSFNGTDSFTTIINQPTAQFYHVITDRQKPYRVYGSQQDNSALSLPAFSPTGAITETEWFVPGGGESGYIALLPKNPDVIFGGAIGSGAGNGRLTRFDRRTGQQRNVTVWPHVTGMGNGANELKYRFQWTFPLMFSPHDPDALYTASNVVHRSRDEGGSWEVISPDLTRADATKMTPSGGPITKDNTGAEVYGTIFALTESPREAGVFWAGSDDGLIHLSRDGGANWTNITPKELPEWSLISVIEASPHDPATAYVAATRYKHDDCHPLLYKTTDYGATWTAINEGLPADAITRVVREDPSQRGLLYCGTETGVFVSFDNGAHWQSFQSNLPVCPIHDLYIEDSDLITATHGRSFWILDDLAPLRQYALQGVRGGENAVHLFTPRPYVRLRASRGFGSAPGTAMSYRNAGPLPITYRRRTKADGTTEDVLINAGQNPPDGVIVRYFLPETPAGRVTLTFLDGAGKEIRTFSSKTPKAAAASEEVREPGAEEESAPQTEQGPWLPATPGLHTFVWDTQYPPATKIPGDTATEEALAGPQAVPGQCTARLTVGEVTQTVAVSIAPDPRVTLSAADTQAQFDLLLAIRDKLTETQDAILAIREMRTQAKDWARRLTGQGDAEAVAAARAINAKLAPIEAALMQEKAADPRQFPIALNGKLATLAGFVAGVDAPPTRQTAEVFAELSALIDAQLAQVREIVAAEVTAFNGHMHVAALPAVVVPRAFTPAVTPTT